MYVSEDFETLHACRLIFESFVHCWTGGLAYGLTPISQFVFGTLDVDLLKFSIKTN